MTGTVMATLIYMGVAALLVIRRIEWMPDSQGEKAMHRYAFIAAMLTVILPSIPAHAVSEKDKMATCKFGADAQKLQGAARDTFMDKCTADRNDPRGPAGAATTGAPPPK
jgi:hypothetical protein